MSTIAYKDGVLVGDRGAWEGSTLVGHWRKVVKCADGAVAGAVGNTTLVQEFLEWAAGPRADPPPSFGPGNGEGLLVEQAGVVRVLEARRRWLRLETPLYAVGSGGQLALGAMLAGAGPEEALRLAARHDAWTTLDHDIVRL